MVSRPNTGGWIIQLKDYKTVTKKGQKEEGKRNVLTAAYTCIRNGTTKLTLGINTSAKLSYISIHIYNYFTF